MGSKCSSDEEDSIELTHIIKAFGVLSVLFSIIEFGLGGAAYAFFTNYKFGAWWGAIIPFISGELAIVKSPKSVVISVLVFSIFAVIVATIGAVFDSQAASVFASVVSCLSSGGTYSGYTLLQIKLILKIVPMFSLLRFMIALAYWNGDLTWFATDSMVILTALTS